MSNSNSTRFYVYFHLKPDGQIFYIGKGSGRRAWSKNLRNKHWWNVVNKYGLVVQIYEDNLLEEDAFDLEAELIKKHRSSSNLVNIADGGGGVSGSHVNLGVPKTEAHKHNLRIANLGKKQELKSIQKRKATMDKKIQDGWINPAKRSECKMIGIKNYNFVGFYVTPEGIYESLAQAAKHNKCTEKAVKVRCRGNTCLVKGKMYTYPPKDGWSFIPR